MKKIVLFFAAVAMLSLTSCKNNDASKKLVVNKESIAAAKAKALAANEFPVITFKKSTFDFGDVEEGKVVTHIFHFTNTGSAPLKVMYAKPSCGCTISDWSKKPIAPGDKGSVTVKFNSRGRQGTQRKSVRLTTNTKNGNETLHFTANVIKK